MTFICHHCGKELSRQQRLDSHIAHFHSGEDGEQCHDEESSTMICPEKYCSGDMPGVAGFSGSPPYIEPPVRHVEKLWTEKNADVEGSAKKKQRRRNWGISRKEYNKKLRLAGKLPSVWEQSTDQKGLGPLSDDEVDEHEDDKGDIFSSGGEDTSDADNAEEGDSENDDEKSDTDIAFDYILDEAREKLNQAENPTDELFRHLFRGEYRRYVILLRHLRKSETHKKIMATVKEVKYRDGDFEYNEALDEGIRLRRKLLDRMVPSLSSETDDEEDEC